MLAVDLAATLERCWAMLARGATDRRSPAHTPAVASITADGLPDQRVMVLRDACADQRLLRFHTDARSPKIAQCAQGSPAHVLVYDVDAKVQLRIRCRASAMSDGEQADAAWAASTNFARRCYLTVAAPGMAVDAPQSGLPAAISGLEPTDAQIAPARVNFAVIIMDVIGIDWLHLANSGHRRARFAWDGERSAWDGVWILP